MKIFQREAQYMSVFPILCGAAEGRDAAFPQNVAQNPRQMCANCDKTSMSIWRMSKRLCVFACVQRPGFLQLFGK